MLATAGNELAAVPGELREIRRGGHGRRFSKGQACGRLRSKACRREW